MRKLKEFWWQWSPWCLRERIRINKEIIESICRDWAEDHTHLQNLCREVGCSQIEVEGTEEGIPTIQDLANSLRAKIK